MLSRQPLVNVKRSAPLFESEPEGVADQPRFLNTVLQVDTGLGPLQLLESCKVVERQGGRQPRRRWGPREIDVDVLLYGDWVVRRPVLQLPHLRMRERGFVLIPLLALTPDLVDPRSGRPLRAYTQAFDDKKVRLFKNGF